jgi:anti-anti-sigma regulatory factor
MPRTRKQTSITLDASLDMSQAGSLLEQAREWQTDLKPLTLNAKKVERVSTASLQILLSLCTTRKANGHSTNIVSPSETFANSLASLQLHPHFKEFIDG